MATILVLELLGRYVGGFVGDVADNLSEVLSDRIQVEKMISGENSW
jgi:hypothetical protein